MLGLTSPSESVCVCETVLLDRVISALTLIFSMADKTDACQLNLRCVLEPRRAHRGSTEAGPGCLRTAACSLVCANTSRGCLSFLCASLRTEFRPEIKGSFLPNCTSASLRAVRIAEVVQVLKRVWSRKSFPGTLCSEMCF